MKSIKDEKCWRKRLLKLFVFSFTASLAFFMLFGLSFFVSQSDNDGFSDFGEINRLNNNAFADDLKNMDMFSQNNILFYDPDNCISSGGNVNCGKTFKEKYWTALLQKFDKSHAAAILGNIVHEGSSPTMWEGKVVQGGHFVNGWTWEKLYDECGGGCGVGVGAFQITSGLSSYLHYINEKSPELIKYFQDPSYSVSGDNLISRIGESEFEKLMQIELEYVFDVMLKNHFKFKMDEFLSVTTSAEAARYWAHNYEICAACGYDKGDSQLDARAADAELIYEEMKNFTCVSSDSSQIFKGKTYELTEGELYAMIHMALKEQSATIEGLKYELTQMANRTDKRGRTDIAAAISKDTFYAYSTRLAYSTIRGSITDEQINAARDVLVYGNRVAPPQVLEHDCIGDIAYVELDGVRHYASNPGECRGKGLFVDSYYVSGKTIIHNNYNSTYVFYSFPISGDLKSGDPFGYFVDDLPSDSSSSGSTSTSDNTFSASTDNDCTTYEGEYPEYLQSDPKWGSTTYGPNRTIASSGCGAASMAMLATVATGQDIFPNDIAKLLGDQYYWQTSVHELDRIVGDYYGFEVVNDNSSSLEETKTKFREYLNDGYMIHFTGAGCHPGFQSDKACSKGHVIGLFSIDEDDNVMQANSAWGGNQKSTLDEVAKAKTWSEFTAIKRSNAKKNTCSNNNYCSASSSSNVFMGEGLTREQAQKIADYYNGNQVTKENFIGGSIPSSYDKVNCVSFSLWFVSAFTDSYDRGVSREQLVNHGAYIARTGLPSVGWRTGNDPTPFSVFGGAGSGAWSHTGVVVGSVDNGKVLTIEAAYGQHDARVMTKSVSYFSKNVGILAYPDAHFTPNEGHLGNKSFIEIIGN